MNPVKIAVLVSGGGTNLQALIDAEKAGIIKENTPVLWCGESKEAGAVIEQAAKEKACKLYQPSHEEIIIKMSTLEKTILDYKGFRNVEIKLLGAYQPINCANVLEAVLALNEVGLDINIPHVIDGLGKAEWHARFEKILDTPLTIFEGIKNYFGSSKVYILTGVMADKDYLFMAEKISSVAAKVFTLTPDNPRALDSEKYAQVFASLGIESKAFKTVKEATKCAVFEAKRDGKPLFCLGSLYMYGEIVEEIKKL